MFGYLPEKTIIRQRVNKGVQVALIRGAGYPPGVLGAPPSGSQLATLAH